MHDNASRCIDPDKDINAAVQSGHIKPGLSLVPFLRTLVRGHNDAPRRELTMTVLDLDLEGVLTAQLHQSWKRELSIVLIHDNNSFSIILKPPLVIELPMGVRTGEFSSEIGFACSRRSAKHNEFSAVAAVSAEVAELES